MKKRFLSLLSISLVAISLWAQDDKVNPSKESEPMTAKSATMTTTAIPLGDYSIYADDKQVEAGQQITLVVNMKNANIVTLWQADMVLPEGITLATDGFGDPLVELSGSRTTATRHSLASNTLINGDIRLLCSSTSNKNFTGNDGEVAKITLNVAPGLENGSYSITFKNILIVEPNETKHTLESSVCTLTVGEPEDISKYDIDGDGKITMNDANIIVNKYLGK